MLPPNNIDTYLLNNLGLVMGQATTGLRARAEITCAFGNVKCHKYRYNAYPACWTYYCAGPKL